MKNLDSLYNVLKLDFRFVGEDGNLLKNKINELSLKVDKKLIKLLLSNDYTKDMFFTEIDGNFVFDKIKFNWTVNSKDFLPDSYTKFENKIMLTDTNNRPFNRSRDVVLSFPYKDGVLVGGQTKEEQKRSEIFYNELLVKNEIDRLLAPKVLSNPIRYSKNKKENIEDISKEDSLLIKGNNLLALSCLTKVYSNSIKLCYCDIPYNTGSDSFGYNDDFKRSTWLTFMKNRAEIIKKLLCKNGVFLVHCSYHQYAYLKVLLDEVLDEKNHKATFNILVRHPERILTGDKEYNDVIEYILIYSKNPTYKMPKKGKIKNLDEYIHSVELLTEGKEIEFDNKKAIMYLPSEYKINKGEPSEEKFKVITVRGSIKEKNSSGRFYMKYLNSLVGTYPEGTLFKVDDIGDDMYPYRFFYLPKNGNKNGAYLQGKPTSSNITYTPYPNFYDFVEDYNNVGKESELEFRNGKKPEKLMEFLIETFTDEGDIVLDAFLGSGTTASVAHKLDRQFIGIEQMDYIDDITFKRLSNVIDEEFEEPNTFKYIENHSFIFFELKKLGQSFIDRVLNAKDDELINIYEELKENEFVNYKVDIHKLEQSKSDFEGLKVEEKRTFLCKIIDKNMLYINYSDIDDETYNVSDEEKLFTKKFYEMGV